MAEKVKIPWETKYKFAVGGYHATIKGFLELIREKYGAEAALKMYERVMKRDDRVKNITNKILEIFKIEGNNAETIARFWDIYCELIGMEYSWLEQSKTYYRSKITKCPWKTGYKDISN